MIIGIVGCGGIARAHVRALCLNPLVTGLALYDVNADNVRELSEISTVPVKNCQDLKQLAGACQGFIISGPLGKRKLSYVKRFKLTGDFVPLSANP